MQATFGWRGALVVRAARAGEAGVAAALLRDANFTPDFPEAARILTAMVEQKRGVELDGVISVDPIALDKLEHVIATLAKLVYRRG